MVRVFRLCFIADVIDVFGPGKQENGFLEFIRQVRRREGERHRSSRDEQNGPSRRLRKGPCAYLLCQQEIPFGELLLNIAVLIHFIHFTSKEVIYPLCQESIVRDDYEHRISLKCKLKCTFGHE